MPAYSNRQYMGFRTSWDSKKNHSLQREVSREHGDDRVNVEEELEKPNRTTCIYKMLGCNAELRAAYYYRAKPP